MLFWIFIALLVTGIACMCAYNRTNVGEWSFNTGMALTIFFGLAVVVSLLIMGIFYIGIDANVQTNLTRYDSLTYQYENNLYDNDNDVGKKELMTEIQDWNEDLAFYQEIQDDFWVGIYVPNVFDQFEFIDLDRD